MERVPVLVVGGGGAGLAASMYLSRMGIGHLLVSALPTTSVLPKAHEINQRAMENLSDFGIVDQVIAAGTPPEQMSHTAFYAGFAGHPLAGRKFWKMECWGASGADHEWSMASPFVASNLPQLRLEPIMKARAEELAPGCIRFGQKVTGLTQDAKGATARVEDVESGERYEVRADYVIAADGGRAVGAMVGVELEGDRDLAQEVSVHLSADFSAFCEDPEVLIRWIFLPHDPTALCVLVPMGPTKWSGESEEWVYHTNYELGDQRAFDDEAVVADMRERLGVGDVPLKVHMVSRWTLCGLVADKYQVGRVFVVGDAAHRHPPTGGLGLNSALHDVQNLCWKLAYVLRGHADCSLLASYEDERRPVDARNVQRSVENSFQYILTAFELGLGDTPETADEKWARVERFLSDDPKDAAERSKAVRLMAAHSMEFHEHDVEYGYEYLSGAVIPDGSPSHRDSDFRLFTAEARPGHPLPHAWIVDVSGTRLSTLDLIPPDRFVLIAGEEGHDWIDAAGALASQGVPIEAVRIGHLDGDYLDTRLRWQRVRGFSARGSVLVRPDRCVAWRSERESDAPVAELRRVWDLVMQKRGAHQ
jgi:2,4-dichlorophenol 6-monooxygenase